MKIIFSEHELVLHHAGVLLWPAEEMLVVSDLHLEKGSHFAKRGYFLPPYDSLETLQRLIRICEASACKRVLILGDCFHDNAGYERMGTEEKNLFHTLHDYDPIWIRGNHDAEFIPDNFEVYDEYESQGLTFRHETKTDATAEISGHFHPKLDVQHKGALISRRCFIEDGEKLILPAFGAYTGGLSVKDPVIRSRFAARPRAYVMGENRLFSVEKKEQN